MPEGLRDSGYVEGKNVNFNFRSAEGRIDILPKLAAELVASKVGFTTFLRIRALTFSGISTPNVGVA
jgi:hypothetical protein